jgi:hypothetical protein
MNRSSALDSLAHCRTIAVLFRSGILRRRLEIATIKSLSAMLPSPLKRLQFSPTSQRRRRDRF